MERTRRTNGIRTVGPIALAALGLLLVCALLADASITGDAPPAMGDWEVKNPTTVRNEVLHIEGNITVTGSLSVYDSVIYINGSQHDQYGLNVEATGSLGMYSSYLGNLNSSITDGYHLLALGKMTLDDTVVEGSWMGLQVMTKETVTVTGCTVLNASGRGLYLVDADATTVQDTALVLNDMIGFWFNVTQPDTASYRYDMVSAAIHVTGGAPKVRDVEIQLNGEMRGMAFVDKLSSNGYVYVYWHFYMLLIEANSRADVSGIDITNGTMNFCANYSLNNSYASKGNWYTYSYFYPHVVSIPNYADVSVGRLSIQGVQRGTSQTTSVYTGLPYGNRYVYNYPQTMTLIQAVIDHTSSVPGPHRFNLMLSEIDFGTMATSVSPLITATLNTNYNGLSPPTYVSDVVIDSVNVDGGRDIFSFVENNNFLLFKTFYMNVRISNSTFTNLTGRMCAPTYNVGPGAGNTNLKSFFIYENMTIENNLFINNRQGSSALVYYAPYGNYDRNNLVDRYFLVRWNTFRDNVGRLFDSQGRTYQDIGGKERNILDGNTFIDNTETSPDYLMYTVRREYTYIWNNQFIGNSYSYGIYLHCEAGDLNGKKPGEYVIRNNTFRDFITADNRPVFDIRWGGTLEVSYNNISDVETWFLRITEYTDMCLFASIDFHHNKISNNDGTMVWLANTGVNHEKLILDITDNEVRDNAGPVVDYLVDSNLDTYDYMAKTRIINNSVYDCTGRVFKDYGEITVENNYFEGCEDYVVDLEYLYLAPPVITGNRIVDCENVYYIVAKEKTGPKMALTMANMTIDCTGNAFYFKNTVATLKSVDIGPRATIAIIADGSMVDAVTSEMPVGSGRVVGTGSINVWFNIELWVTWGDAFGQDTHQPVVEALVVRYTRNGMYYGSELTDAQGHVRASRYPQWSIVDTMFTLWSPYTITVAKSGSVDHYTVDLDQDLVGPDALWFLLVDTFVPELSISSPVENDRLSVSDLTVRGLVVEVGSGLTEVLISYNLEGQEEATPVDVTVGADFEFQHTFADVPEGVIVIHLRVKDHAVNTNQTSLSIVVDRTPPALEIASPADGAVTRDKTVMLRCVFEAGATLRVNGERSPDTSGDVSVPVDLKDGSNIIYVEVSDAAGNSVAMTRTLTLDRSAPPLTVLYPSQGVTVTASGLQVTGDAEKGATILISVVGPQGNVLLDNVSVTQRADGTFVHDVDLAEGPCTIVVHAEDVAGNVARVTRAVTLDTVPPDLAIAYPPNDMATNQRTVELRGTVDPDATLCLDGVMLSHDGTFTATVVLNEGTNTIKLRVVDPYGNEVTHRLTVTLDTVVPIVVLTQPGNHMLMTNSPSVVVAGRVIGDVASLKVGGAGVQVATDGTFTCTVTVQPGPSDLVIEAVDAVGNRAEMSVHVDMDTELPMLSVGYSPAGSAVEAQDNSLVITGSTSLDVASVEVSQTFGGATVTDVYYPIGPDGGFTIVRRLGEGQNSIVLRVVDSHGNVNETSPYSVSWKYLPPKAEKVVEEAEWGIEDVALVIAVFSVALIVIVVIVSRGFAQRRA